MPDLYISGSLGFVTHRDATYCVTPHRLLSLHGDYLRLARKFLFAIGDIRDTSDMCIMLDSGAFTAWNKNQSDLDVRELLDLYKKVQKFCDGKFKATYFISLDKIPGKPGTTPTPDEIRDAIKISDANHHILAAELGDNVLPVFHQSEPIERLHEVVAMNTSYVCVSPRNDVAERHRRLWAQRVHQLIPGVRTHGLATTGGEMMLETPWSSVDSAAWMFIASFGMVFLPVKGTMRTFAISDHSPDRKRWGKHAETVHSPETKKMILDICDKLSITWKELQTQGGARELFNVYVTRQISEMPYRPTLVEQALVEL